MKTAVKLIKRLFQGDRLIGQGIVSDQNRTYQLLEKLGQGGMGIVYRAVDEDGQIVAVKITTLEQGIRRFKLETAVLKLLGNHDNLPKLYDWGLEESPFKFCVMEFIPGDSLHKIIKKRDKKFYSNPLKNTLSVGIDLLKALTHAQKKKIVHRDIKPENLILMEKGREKALKLMDFGVSKTLEKGFLSFLHRSISFDEKTLTLPGQPIGTLGYAPKEQLDNRVVDESADVFSSGITLWEVLKGDFLFHSLTLSSYLKDLDSFHFEPIDIPDTNQKVLRKLNLVLKKAMDPNPRSRYRRASKMLKELESLDRELQKSETA